MAKTQIKNYVFKPGIGANDNLFPNAYSLLTANKSFIQKEATAWIQDQVDANVTGFVGYTYNQAKYERDVGYIVDAYLSDLRYGGNEHLRNVIKYYWDQDVAQVDGDRQPEIQTHTFIGTLITDYIFTKIAYSASNTQVTQTLTGNVAEAGAATVISTLVLNTVAVITNGLSSMPTAIPTGVGTIKIQGRYGIDDLLLITNSTRSEVIYNFTNSVTGATLTVKDSGSDDDFVKYLQTTDGVTTIKLNYNTSTHLSTDDVQIFVEGKEVRTRPYDFGTDAIERPRAALPVSMLDADFEYGLQPTKWSAISTMRGYPSVYEIPGTDASVLSVISDASSGTEGIGQSLITVTTISSHGFIIGTPISLKALENSIAGAARAEGTFIIVNIPSANTFQYFAKAKVGTVAGQVLSTGYTQLREAGFYTGASIGSPVFTVASNGSSGSLVTQLGVLAGEVRIPFDGQSPEIGSPLSQANIPLGSQVSGIIDQSAGGGTYVTPALTAEYGPGTTTVTVIDATGIVENLAVDRGDGIAIYVNSILSNDITFSDPFTAELVGNTVSYNSVTATTVQGFGTFLEITITASTGSYIIDSIDIPGTDYAVGDRVLVSGNLLGGSTPTNDLTLQVVSTTAGAVTSLLVITGTAFDGIGDYNNFTAPGTEGNDGLGARFDFEYTAGVYTSVTVTGAGSHLTMDAFGAADAARTAGTYNGVTGTSSGTGSVGTFNIVVDGTGLVTSVVVETAGSGHAVNNTITIADSLLGGGGAANFTMDVATIGLGTAGTGYSVNDRIKVSGTSATPLGIDPQNNILITVAGIDINGEITSVTTSGTAPDAQQLYNNPAFTTSGSGTSLNYSVTRLGAVYSITFAGGGNGAGFLPTETITVAGTQLGGLSTANDCTITIDNVDGTGAITATTVTGTANNFGDAVNATSAISPGINAIFDISYAAGIYTIDTIVNAGVDYGVNQTFLINGVQLGGGSPANDLTITIDSVSNVGGITGVTPTGSAPVGSGTFTNISPSNIQANGTGATFNIIRSNSAYTIGLANAGNSYYVGNRLIISGAVIGGATPLNDITFIVTGETAGVITSVTDEWTIASAGTNFDLISTVTLTEATIGAIAIGETITFSAIASLEVEFGTAHGLVPGDTFITSVKSDDTLNNHNLAAGSYIATAIPTVSSLIFQARAVGAIDTTLDEIQGEVYPRPDSFFVHRPFDGGVQLGTGGPQHGAQAIRQSKKYIRYQSGKGIMYTTGALFAPSYDLRSVTADAIEVGSEITIITDDNDHGVQVNGIIRLLGVETPGYNSGSETAVPPYFDYTVTEVVDERTFKVLSKRRLGSTSAVLGFGAQMSVVAWHGATVRSGIFDDQNGIFWEFDGTQINVVQRTGTFQVAGTIAIDVDKNLVTGTNTRFRDQLKAGDRIIIRGMTHVVSHVDSQSELSVTPDFRGVTNVTGAKAMIVFDKRTRQADFNLDRLDGTGPSGYDIDIAKMQMIGIQYSWYGAGFIDFMLRGSDGNFVFAHRMRNSNVNTEAFMRSGNLPVRYEVTNEGPNGKLAADMTVGQTTILLDAADGMFFPYRGTVYIDNEIIQFTGRTDNTLTGCIRSATFTNFQGGAVRSYTAGAATSHSTKTGVILISQTITPLISHWGSAMITDGGFDEDRGYIFSYSETGITVSTTKQTAFMIRLSPSVSNAITGDLGERELLNRAQLLLQGLEVTSDGFTGSTPIQGGIVIEGVLNPQNYPLNPGSVNWTGLSGVAQGGQPSFAQIAAGGSVVWSTGAAATTATATAQGNLTTTSTIRYGSGTNRNYIYARRPSWEASGAAVGDFITASTSATWSSGIQITNVEGPYGGSGNNAYYVVRLSSNYSGQVNENNTVTMERRFTVSNRNVAYFTKASWDATDAKLGTTASGGSVTFIANTLVNVISLTNYGGTEYYEVRFNNSYTGTLEGGSGTVIFTFVQPAFAQPGETVFSFIAVPGERSTLDLSALKELTNTPLGGRGTFPNGPDVLAINVYKVSGVDSVSNIILRWGEAQA